MQKLNWVSKSVSSSLLFPHASFCNKIQLMIPAFHLVIDNRIVWWLLFLLCSFMTCFSIDFFLSKMYLTTSKQPWDSLTWHHIIKCKTLCVKIIVSFQECRLGIVSCEKSLSFNLETKSSAQSCCVKNGWYGRSWSAFQRTCWF